MIIGLLVIGWGGVGAEMLKKGGGAEKQEKGIDGVIKRNRGDANSKVLFRVVNYDGGLRIATGEYAVYN